MKKKIIHTKVASRQPNITCRFTNRLLQTVCETVIATFYLSPASLRNITSGKILTLALFLQEYK